MSNKFNSASMGWLADLLFCSSGQRPADDYTMITEGNQALGCGDGDRYSLKLKVLAKIYFIVFLTVLGVK